MQKILDSLTEYYIYMTGQHWPHDVTGNFHVCSPFVELRHGIQIFSSACFKCETGHDVWCKALSTGRRNSSVISRKGKET